MYESVKFKHKFTRARDKSKFVHNWTQVRDRVPAVNYAVPIVSEAIVNARETAKHYTKSYENTIVHYTVN